MIANGVRLFTNAMGAIAATYWFGLGLIGFCVAVAFGFVLYAVLMIFSLLRIKSPKA
jgi:hypothetical protein